jgi:hypothetical protein
MKMTKFQKTIVEGNMLERTIDTLIKNYIRCFFVDDEALEDL